MGEGRGGMEPRADGAGVGDALPALLLLRVRLLPMVIGALVAKRERSCFGSRGLRAGTAWWVVGGSGTARLSTQLAESEQLATACELGVGGVMLAGAAVRAGG